MLGNISHGIYPRKSQTLVDNIDIERAMRSKSRTKKDPEKRKRLAAAIQNRRKPGSRNQSNSGNPLYGGFKSMGEYESHLADMEYYGY